MYSVVDMSKENKFFSKRSPVRYSTCQSAL